MPTQRLTTAFDITLREAVSTDAEAIFYLMRSAFLDTYLVYTVYQASQTLEFLRSLIPVQEFAVAESGTEIVGYYNAVPRNGYLFLNYIAVTPRIASQGVGTKLVLDCASKAGQNGCAGIELDVFASNRRAVRWYERIGFEIVKSSHVYRLCLRKLPKPTTHPMAHSLELQRALLEEQHHGFSKLACKYMAHEFLVGLIAGHTCKLLQSSDSLSDHDSAAAIAALFPHRSYLILRSNKPPVSSLPVADHQVSLRMRKSVI